MADRSIIVSLRADVGGYTAGMGRAAASTKALEANVSAMQAGMARGEGGLRNLGSRSEEAAKSGGLLSGAFKEFGGIASVAGVGAIGLAGGIGFAVKSFMDFDSKMASVRANIGATGSEASKLGGYIRDAGTKFGFSADQSADAADDLAKAGLNTSQVMGGALTSALALAAAGNVSTGESAEMLATSMSQFGIKVHSAADAAREYGHAADLIAAGADKSTASVHSISEGLQNVGGVAHQFGMSMQDTVGVLAEFDQSGLKGAEGGTALKVMLQQLVNQSPQVQKSFEQYGIQAFDAQGHFKGLGNLADQLKTKLGGMSQQQRMAALSTMFGTHAIQAASILYKDGAAGVKHWSDTVNASGFAAKNAAAKTDSLKGDLNKLKAEFLSLAIQAGGLADGPLRALAHGLIDIVSAGKPLLSFAQGVMSVFGSLPGPIKNAALAFAGLAIANRAFGDRLGSTKENISNFVGGLHDLGQQTGTVVRTAEGAEQTMGRFGSSVAAIGQDVPAIARMQSAFVNASQSAERMPRTIGATKAAMAGLSSAASGAVEAVGGPFQAALIAAPLAIEAFRGLGRAMSDLPDTTVQQARQNILGLSQSGGTLSQAFGEVKSKTDGVHTALGLVSGAFGWFNAGGVDKAKDNVKQFDGALASMVESGHAKEAAQYIKQQGLSAADASKYLPTYSDAVRKAGSDSKQAAQDSKNLQGGMEGAAKAAGGDAEQYQSLQKALEDTAKQYTALNNALLEQRGGARGYQASIRDMSQALKENGRTLDITTQKGSDNQEKLDNMASAAGKFAGATYKQTGSMAQANAVLTDARSRYVNMATAMGMSRPKAEQLAKSIIQVTDAAGNPINLDVHSGGLDDVTVKLDKMGNEVMTLKGSQVSIPAETPNAPQVLQTLTALGLTAKQLSSDGTKVTIPTEALKAPETRKAIEGIKGAVKDAHGNVTIPTSALNSDATRNALKGIKDVAVTLSGQVVRIPASTPNGAQVKQLLEGIHGAVLSTNGKKVTINSSAPLSSDTRNKILAIKGAQISADGKHVNIPTSAATAPNTKRLIDAVNQSRKNTDGKSARVNTSAPGATTAKGQIDAAGHSADSVNGKHSTITVTSVFKTIGQLPGAFAARGIAKMLGGATGGAIGDLRNMPRFAAGGYLGQINGKPYGWQDGRVGGKVNGPGSSTSDQVITMTSRGLVRTANDEHIIAGNEVAGFGGHAGIYRMRQMAKAGTLPRFATGGSTDGTGYTPDMSDIMQLLTSLRVDPQALADLKKQVADQKTALAKARTAVATASSKSTSLRGVPSWMQGQVSSLLRQGDFNGRYAGRGRWGEDDKSVDALLKMRESGWSPSVITRMMAQLPAQARAAARVTLQGMGVLPASEKNQKALAAALEKQAKASQTLEASQKRLAQMAPRAKMDTAGLFLQSTNQQNAVSKKFLDNIDRIRKRGFPRLAMSLLNQGDADAQSIAQTLAGGSLSRLRAEANGLDQSDALAKRKQSLLDNLTGTVSGSQLNTAASDQGKALLAMRGAQNALAYSTSVRETVAPIDYHQLAQAVVGAQPKPSSAPVVVHLDGREVGRGVMPHVMDTAATQAGYGSVFPGLS